MKSIELRIGNYIIQGGELTVVESLGRDLRDWDRVNGKRALDCKPIAITERWLLEVGFEFRPCGISGADMWQGMGFWTKELPTGIIVLRGDKKVRSPLKLNGYYNCKVEYIHELQNLFRALTGKELNQQTKTIRG